MSTNWLVYSLDCRKFSSFSCTLWVSIAKQLTCSWNTTKHIKMNISTFHFIRIWCVFFNVYHYLYWYVERQIGITYWRHEWCVWVIAVCWLNALYSIMVHSKVRAMKFLNIWIERENNKYWWFIFHYNYIYGESKLLMVFLIYIHYCFQKSFKTTKSNLSPSLRCSNT